MGKEGDYRKRTRKKRERKGKNNSKNRIGIPIFTQLLVLLLVLLPILLKLLPIPVLQNMEGFASFYFKGVPCKDVSVYVKSLFHLFKFFYKYSPPRVSVSHVKIAYYSGNHYLSSPSPFFVGFFAAMRFVYLLGCYVGIWFIFSTNSIFSIEIAFIFILSKNFVIYSRGIPINSHNSFIFVSRVSAFSPSFAALYSIPA